MPRVMFRALCMLPHFILRSSYSLYLHVTGKDTETWGSELTAQFSHLDLDWILPFSLWYLSWWHWLLSYSRSPTHFKLALRSWMDLSASARWPFADWLTMFYIAILFLLSYGPSCFSNPTWKFAFLNQAVQYFFRAEITRGHMKLSEWDTLTSAQSGIFLLFLPFNSKRYILKATNLSASNIIRLVIYDDCSGHQTWTHEGGTEAKKMVHGHEKFGIPDAPWHGPSPSLWWRISPANCLYIPFVIDQFNHLLFSKYVPRILFPKVFTALCFLRVWFEYPLLCGTFPGSLTGRNLSFPWVSSLTSYRSWHIPLCKVAIYQHVLA